MYRVTPSWNNTTRKGKQAFLFKNRNPEKFKTWYAFNKQHLGQSSSDDNYIFINAWNKWVEGNHLEPCQQWGHQFLKLGCMVKVSVIIPNYNHARYLPQRIESVLQQTFTDFEVIILDDCSKDDSKAVINQYAHHPKVSYILFNEQNSGSTFIQWKKGFDLAQGEYIWIAESDDMAAPTFLDSLVHALDQDEQTSIAYCPSYWVDENDQIIMTPALGKQEYLEGKWFIQQYFLTGNAIPNASMAIFRKEALEKVDFGKIITLKYCGDWLFWAYILNDSRIYRHHQTLNYYRRHAESVSTFSDKIGLFFIEGLKVVREVSKLLFIDVKQYFRISRLWGYKLFEHRKKNQPISAPIFNAFVKYLPAGLIFFLLYSIKYCKRSVQD